MAILPLLKFPDERLYTRAVAVTEVNDSIRQVINDMFETMYAESGIGLAATQVNIHQRIVVVDLSEEQQPQIFINPQIMTQEGSACISEGCLSVPGFRAEVPRAASVTIRALDAQGNPFTLSAEGLLAICLQHEIDHLNGKLFIDYLSLLKRQRLQQRYKKLAKSRAS